VTGQTLISELMESSLNITPRQALSNAFFIAAMMRRMRKHERGIAFRWPAKRKGCTS
jgi:hypothetical protein